MPTEKPTVTLFIPCIVDQLYPEMGIALVRLLRRWGFEVRFDPQQTCCGQPAFNAGYRDEAREVAQRFLPLFADAELVVCPSGSCTAMVRNFFPELLPAERSATALGTRVLEFSEFLSRFIHEDDLRGRFPRRVGFHVSCHGLRELGLPPEIRDLLAGIEELQWTQPEGDPVCCGFGGLFSWKFAEIAAGMAKTRLEMFVEAGAEVIVSNDPGCIHHLRQEAQALGLEVEILHLVELLDRALVQE